MSQHDTLAPKRPECFDFAMDFLGGTEAAALGEYIERLEATLSATQPAQAAQGWKLVPVEPTKEMRNVQTWDFNRFYPPAEIWAAMLAASPTPPAHPAAAQGAGEVVADLKRLASVCPELNLNNYGPDDVDELNAWAIEVSQAIDTAIAASGRQS